MELYKDNKNAKVGTIIECPICHTKFKKTQYSQAFCCTKCKDKFHNRYDGDRHTKEFYERREKRTDEILQNFHRHFILPTNIMDSIAKQEIENEIRQERINDFYDHNDNYFDDGYDFGDSD